MKRVALLMLVLAVAAGCRPRANRQLSGAPTPRAAVETFLSAVRAQDIQALSSVWGDENGLVRDRLSRDEVDKRSLLMHCYFGHQRFRILSDTPNSGGRHIFRVELVKGDLTRATNFTVTRGPGERWFVENADINPVKDLCQQAPR